MTKQSLAETAPDASQQFNHYLSLAAGSKSDKQRRDALAYLTSQLLSKPPNNPVGTYGILAKLLPLISDISAGVRTQLLKLLRALPEFEVQNHAEMAAMYIRAGMTHVSSDISGDALSVLEWLLDVACDELVSCPGGWVKTLNSFCAIMGWSVAGNSGWSSAPKSTMRAKDAVSHAKQLSTLATFLRAGLKAEAVCPRGQTDYWDNLYRTPRASDPFSYLNLFGKRRDEEGEMYGDREARHQIFMKRYYGLISTGTEKAKKEGGAAGRSATVLDQVLRDGMDSNAGGSLVEVDAQDLLGLW
jgi:pre-rRNA-processing protein IPI1